MDAGATCSFSDIHAQKPTVTCTDDGTVKLTLTVKDDNGGVGRRRDAHLANVKPVATAGSPYSGYEGSAIQLNGSADDPGDNDDPYLTYKWTVNTAGVDAGGQCTFDDDTKKNAQVTCTDDSNGGTFALSLVATDDDGASSVASTTSLTVTNAKPIATAGGPYSGAEGSAIQLNGSADDPGNNDDPYLTYKWTASTTGIDGGGSCSFDNDTKKDAKVTCTDDSNGGTFTLSLVATDDDGASSVASTTNLTVTNLAPVATAGGGYSGSEGAAIALNGSADDSGNNDDPYLTYKWTATAAGIDAGGNCSFDNAPRRMPRSPAPTTATAAHSPSAVATDDDGASRCQHDNPGGDERESDVAMPTKPDGSALPTTIIVAGTLNIKVPFSDAEATTRKRRRSTAARAPGTST